jgi:hypothetical protein
MPKVCKKVVCLFNKEKTTKKPIVSFDRVYQKTSKALGVSYMRVRVSLDFDILIEYFISL